MPGSSASKTKTPVRMGKVFSQMLTDCPLDIQVYGKCVADIHGGVSRQACEKEFQKLRACFKRVAHKRRA
ncbi:NADH dehydrogenase [ubiquinone] 1 alpha subcomplex assembly factor 8 [Phytophthora cinnamomi]|uniref:NADH dehydrogenase [ubiquinone] 1 alpha subcomplex assembly factor 8 n=1 Tax=Phytophthora cinnamomi TaxID=4785 RepID=UPI0035595D4E|nr:NADH dehydrogenase [ubiquinone] 1 alpha subcomplex assembly factor 8 [Phytophthora cinnamomi]